MTVHRNEYGLRAIPANFIKYMFMFFDFSGFKWGHTLPNYGIGYRWEFKNRVNVRLDYGFGKKGQSGFLFNINEAF